MEQYVFERTLGTIKVNAKSIFKLNTLHVVSDLVQNVLRMKGSRSSYSKRKKQTHTQFLYFFLLYLILLSSKCLFHPPTQSYPPITHAHPHTHTHTQILCSKKVAK